MKRTARTALIFWAAATALVAASIWVIYLKWGIAGFDLFIEQWPLTNLPIVLASTALTWLLAGFLLYLLANRKINASNALTFAGFFLTAFVYLNILSERFRYGDYMYYIEAASNLLNHKPLPDTYLYLPLWATILEPLVPLGDETILLILWLVNIFSLFLFYFLLHRLLEKYGFSIRLAAIVTTLFILVNTPLLRTLGYVQVNLLVINFIFLSFLLYPKQPFLSALSLAVAVQIKTSPAVIVLAFLLEKDWRWLGWFAFSFAVLTAIPAAVNGVSPYFDYLNNIRGLTQLHDSIFHDTSFDSFFRFILPALKINRSWIEITADTAKVLLAAATFYVMAKCVQIRTFFASEERGANLLNAAPPLFILMTLASPLVWEHHGIFVTLSFLLMLKQIDSPSEWMWFGFAGFLEFVLPTFDFFPWSYGRLLAPLIILWLMWKTLKNQKPPRLFTAFNHQIEKMQLEL
jgi:hypothetical protein